MLPYPIYQVFKIESSRFEQIVKKSERFFTFTIEEVSVHPQKYISYKE